LSFAAKPLEHMAEAGRMVPRITLAQAILTGARSADPQGAEGAIQITQTISRGGKDYTLRIIYNELEKKVLHFDYSAIKN
jgi:hypothetical protein